MSRKFILNFDYALIQGTYWGFYIVTAIFVSVYLLGKGYSNTSIGIVIAMGNILAIFLQMLMADIMDRSKKINDISLIKIMLALLFVLTCAILFIGSRSLILTVIYTVVIVVHTALHPIVNSLSFTLSRGGEQVNFGIGRSMGSLVAAVLGLAMGYMVSDFGVDVIIITGLVMLLIMEIAMFVTGSHYKRLCTAAEKEPEGSYITDNDAAADEAGADCMAAEGADSAAVSEESGGSSAAGIAEKENVSSAEIGYGEFIKENKAFMLMSFGVAALFFGNVILENFTIQIVDSIGGDTAQMGIVVFVQAILEMPAMLFFGNLKSRFSYVFLLRASVVFFAVKIIMVWLAPSMIFIYIAQFNQVLGYGLMLPAMVGFINEIMPQGEAVRGQAVFTTAITVGNVIGCVFGGRILDLSTVGTLLCISSMITVAGGFVISAAVKHCGKDTAECGRHI